MNEFLRGTVTPKDWAAVAVILGATLLISAVFVFLVGSEQNRKLAQIEEALQVTLGDLEQAREIERNFASLRRETEKIQRLVSEFENRLPLRREIPRLLEQFEALADEVGLEVELETKLRIQDQRKETIPYSITARGGFHQIVSFINWLERFERYLKISDLSIGEEEYGVSEAKFTLSTFRFIESGSGAVS